MANGPRPPATEFLPPPEKVTFAGAFIVEKEVESPPGELLAVPGSIIVASMVASTWPEFSTATIVELQAAGGVISVSLSVMVAFAALSVTSKVSVTVKYTVG